MNTEILRTPTVLVDGTPAPYSFPSSSGLGCNESDMHQINEEGKITPQLHMGIDSLDRVEITGNSYYKIPFLKDTYYLPPNILSLKPLNHTYYTASKEKATFQYKNKPYLHVEANGSVKVYQHEFKFLPEETYYTDYAVKVPGDTPQGIYCDTQDHSQRWPFVVFQETSYKQEIEFPTDKKEVLYEGLFSLKNSKLRSREGEAPAALPMEGALPAPKIKEEITKVVLDVWKKRGKTEERKITFTLVDDQTVTVKQIKSGSGDPLQDALKKLLPKNAITDKQVDPDELRRYESLKSEMSRNFLHRKWETCEKVYQDILTLKTVPIEAVVYYDAAYIASVMGDITSQYDRMQRALKAGNLSDELKEGAQTTLNDIKNNYGYVEIIIPHPGTYSLQPQGSEGHEMNFLDPGKRENNNFVNDQLISQGSFRGLLATTQGEVSKYSLIPQGSDAPYSFTVSSITQKGNETYQTVNPTAVASTVASTSTTTRADWFSSLWPDWLKGGFGLEGGCSSWSAPFVHVTSHCYETLFGTLRGELPVGSTTINGALTLGGTHHGYTEEFGLIPEQGHGFSTGGLSPSAALGLGFARYFNMEGRVSLFYPFQTPTNQEVLYGPQDLSLTVDSPPPLWVPGLYASYDHQMGSGDIVASVGTQYYPSSLINFKPEGSLGGVYQPVEESFGVFGILTYFFKKE